MRRREPEVESAPVELTSYVLWAAARGVEPFGDEHDRRSLKDAVIRHRAWRDERAAWCAARGLDEWEALGPMGPAPYYSRMYGAGGSARRGRMSCVALSMG